MQSEFRKTAMAWRLARLTARVTQAEIARRSGISRCTISAIENGGKQSCTMETYDALARAYGSLRQRDEHDVED